MSVGRCRHFCPQYRINNQFCIYINSFLIQVTYIGHPLNDYVSNPNRMTHYVKKYQVYVNLFKLFLIYKYCTYNERHTFSLCMRLVVLKIEQGKNTADFFLLLEIRGFYSNLSRKLYNYIQTLFGKYLCRQHTVSV